ncbi:MAG: NAD(P)(+) transhydrogenase (Si-specific) [Terracidiphilus sp.]|jgi:NAD(P) transhydrogenase
MSAVNYDLIVIGSGPSGQRAAVAAAKMNKRVAVVEARSVVGGVCINTGTIPSKTMREAVLHLSGYNYRSVYGMNYRVKEKISMADLAFRVQAVIKTEVDVTEAQLSRNGIDVVHGMAHFVDPHHVRVEGPQTETTLESARIIVAVGTRPAASPKVPVNGRTIVNSDQILNLPELPRSLIVVGGGVVGVEYACMFAVLGVRVTLIEKRNRLLEFADQEIIEALSYHLRDSRVTLRLGEEVESVEELTAHASDKDPSLAAVVQAPGDKPPALHSSDKPPSLGTPALGTVVANLQSRKKVSGDALLYAVGRQGNIDELNLSAAGLEADNRGRIPVDEHYQTKVEHIFAVGDVVGFPALASVSMEQGRIAAARAFNDKATSSNPSFYPYGIYTIPEISFIGKTEEQLTDEDVPYEVGMAYYRESARGQIRGDTTGRLKMIFHRDTRKVLGVHIIGEEASELVHIGQAVMILGGTVDYFIDTVFNYPTLAECYKVAAFNGLGRLHRYQSE